MKTVRVLAIVLALASQLLAQPAPARSIWVLQQPDRLVEYDSATLAPRKTVSVPPRVFERPEYLSVNAQGQLLFAVPSGIQFGGDLERTANLVWFWDGRAAREWTRDGGPDARRQWFLSRAGDVLYAFETRQVIDRDRDGTERSVRTSTRLLQTDLSGGGAQTALALGDLPACVCQTGSCSETCPIWTGWAPGDVIGDSLLVTRFVEGQLQADYQQSRIYQRKGREWNPRTLSAPVEIALDASADGAVLVEGVYDSGCCGWINESSDQLAVIKQGKRTVIYDEWARFDNRNYDASFVASDARLDPSAARLAYTITADAPKADEELRVSSDGKANPAELARIRKAQVELPAVEIVDLTNLARPRITIAGAELVGWVDAEEIVVAMNGRLVVFDRQGMMRRDTPIRLRGRLDARLP